MPDDQLLREIIPLELFLANNFEGPISNLKFIEAHSLVGAYRRAAAEAQSDGRDSDVKVFSILDEILSMHFKPDDRANVWGPRSQGITWRLAIPADFKGEQSEIFLSLLEHIKNPSLKARLADIVWTNNRKEIKAATLAINSYSECVEGLLSGMYVSEFENDGLMIFDSYKYAQRGLQIAHATSKKGKLPENICGALKNLYQRAKSENAFMAFRNAAELGCYYELLEPEAVAKDVEQVASATDSKTYPMAAKAVFDFGVQLYTKLQNEEGKRRCQVGAVDQLLAMRSQVSSAGAEASWVMDALQALKHIRGMEEKEAELELDLRRLQKASVQEMVAIPIDLDVSEDRDLVIKAFEEYDFSTALRNFALLDKSRPVEALRQEALATIDTNPLMANIGQSHIDGEGKTVLKVSGADGRSEPDEDWIYTTINRSESLRRYYTVAGRIDPARQVIGQRFTITEEHFAPIVGCSPLVPQSQKPIMALGFARFLQGDFMSATHLLLPQIEPCLRHILKINGHDPSKRRDDSTEEDLSFASLVERMRPELEQIFTQRVLSEIDLLFGKRPGPALRHEMAHGKIGVGGCFHPDVIYACWLIYRLCCLFVLPDWDKLIEPAFADGR